MVFEGDYQGYFHADIDEYLLFQYILQKDIETLNCHLSLFEDIDLFI